MMEAEPKHQSTIDWRIGKGTSPTDIIALIVVPDKQDIGGDIFVS